MVPHGIFAEPLPFSCLFIYFNSPPPPFLFDCGADFLIIRLRITRPVGEGDFLSCHATQFCFYQLPLIRGAPFLGVWFCWSIFPYRGSTLIWPNCPVLVHLMGLRYPCNRKAMRKAGLNHCATAMALFERKSFLHVLWVGTAVNICWCEKTWRVCGFQPNKRVAEISLAAKSVVFFFFTLLDVLMIHRKTLLSHQKEEPCLAVTKPWRAAPFMVFLGFICSIDAVEFLS